MAWAAQSYVMTISRAEERVTASAKIRRKSWRMGLPARAQTLRRIDDALRADLIVYDGNIRSIDAAAKGLPKGVLALRHGCTGPLRHLFHRPSD